MSTRSILILLAFGGLGVQPLDAQDAFHYNVDVTNPQDDLFHVTLDPPPLAAGDSIYSFTAFAPGVHQVLDFGRFVTLLRAFDGHNREIPVVRRSTNDWLISEPTRVAEIRYDMEDSFDAEVKEHVIYPMSGTGIEPEYVAINTHGLFGWFVDHRSDPVTVELLHSEDWTVGTALDRNENGQLAADSYYRLADSPILVGDLTAATRQIGDIDVEAYVYSPDSSITADAVLTLADPVLRAAYDFVGYAPVDRYAFLMYFSDEDARNRNPSFVASGALEHSYSSTYALPAVPHLLPLLTDVVAHEFMHILTPLNLRSEIIAEWDYSRPTGEDRHLWLYEGVTEWVAHIMQLRAGMIKASEFLDRISEKIRSSENYNSDWSLARLSAEWFTDEGRGKYGDIYQLGPVTATCLDLRLLELSNGERGLRDVFVELMHRYGPDRPFDNDTFFDEVVETTYPEIRSFIEDHILARKPIDFARCFAPIGVRYLKKMPADDPTPQFGLRLTGADGGRLQIAGFLPDHEPFGLREGDVILQLFGEDVTQHNADSVFAKKEGMRVGDEYALRVLRDGEEIELTGKLVPRSRYHVLRLEEHPTPVQVRMRRIWSRN